MTPAPITPSQPAATSRSSPDPGTKTPVGLATQRALIAAGLILFLSVGARQGFGLFLLPIATDLGGSREAIAAVIAVQYLVWGLTGPLGGLFADRFGALAVLWAGAILYTVGFLLAAVAQDMTSLMWSAGLAIGLGLGGANYGVIHGAVARRVAPAERGRALGVVNAMTAFGQLILLFVTGALLQSLGWRAAFGWHAVVVLMIVPLAWWLMRVPETLTPAAPGASDSRPSEASDQGGWPALAAALRRRDFWLLCSGFAFSGAQVMFTMTHLPAMIHDHAAPADLAVWALAAVSLSAFVGSLLFGRLADRYRKSHLLAALYLCRAGFALAWLVMPFEPGVLVVYFALLGIVWTSTIPVASALTAELFGARYLSTLFSVVFLMHQLGGFFGTWLGGRLYDRLHSYQPMWWALAAACLLGAVLAFLIRAPTTNERQSAR